MSNINKVSDRFREIRTLLDLTQQGLADRLLLSRNYITQIETGTRTPSPRVLSAAEALLTKAHTANVDTGHHLISGRPPDSRVDEPSARYETVASRIPLDRRMPTRADCEDLLQQVLDAAEAEGSPENIPVIYHRLKKQFPPDEWGTQKETE